eukprot:445797_1
MSEETIHMPKPSKTSSVGPLLPAVPSQPALNHAPPVTVSAYRRAKTILDTANGRDKSLKCVQEVLRLASLMLRIRQQQQNSSMKSASDHSNELISSLDTFTSRISGARAFLRLFKFLGSVDILVSRKSCTSVASGGRLLSDFQCTVDTVDTVNVVAGLIIDFCDDVSFWSTSGLLPSSWAAPLDRWSLRAWWLTVFVDLWLVHVQIGALSVEIRRFEMKSELTAGDQAKNFRLKRKRFGKYILLFKLLGDLGVSSLGVRQVGIPGTQHKALKYGSGLLSGVMSTWLLWRAAGA